MFRDLRTQLLLWTILPFSIILLLVASVGVSSHQASMREMVAERDGVVARVAAAQWTDALTMRAHLLPSLDPALGAQCGTACTAFDGGIALFDENGNLVNAMPVPEGWEARRAFIAKWGTPLETFTLTMEDGTPQIILAFARGKQILMGVFTPPPLVSLGLGEPGVAYVVDTRGKIIAHPDAARLGEDLSQHEGVIQVLRGEAGATFHHTEGAELVVGYAPIAPTGWGLIVEEPWAEIVAPMFQYSVLLPLALALIAMVALGVIYFGVRNVHQPLQRLAHAANRIAYGDYRAAETPVGGIHEIEDLRATLDAMARQVSAAQNAMRSYITAITRGQEDERMRLARELHDDTTQSLIALQQRIEIVEKSLIKDPALASARLKELRELVGASLTSLRRFVRDLRPTYLSELGLIPALEMLTQQVGASFEVSGEERRLDAERELAVYRIVQEALRNVAKHAQAQNVSVTLTFDSQQVMAMIQDDGIGFAASETLNAYARAGHFGLMGMQERAQLFGGKVYIQSKRGQGTKVVVHVPAGS